MSETTGTPELDYTTALGQVRVLAADTAAPYLLPDGALLGLLAMEGVTPEEARGPLGDVPVRALRLAAASALETIARSEAMVSKKIRTTDLSTDGPAVAAELRLSAAALRAQVAADDDLELGSYTTVIEAGWY